MLENRDKQAYVTRDYVQGSIEGHSPLFAQLLYQKLNTVGKASMIREAM